MWVTIFKCFSCGKHGKKDDFIKCGVCEEAYYCDCGCERRHSKVHQRVCVAAVAAKARQAKRERLARAVREKGSGQVEGADEDELCVICQAKPVEPMEASGKCGVCGVHGSF